MDNTGRRELIEELAPLHPFQSDTQGGDRICRICGLLAGGVTHVELTLADDGLGCARGSMVAMGIEAAFFAGLFVGLLLVSLHGGLR